MRKSNNERQEQRSSEHCEIQYAKQGNRKHKVIGIITVVAIIVVVAIVVFALFGGRSEKKVVQYLIDSQMTANTEKVWEVLPKEVQEAALAEMKDEGYENIEEVFDELDDEINDTLRDLDEYFGDDWTYSYEITDETEYSSSEIRDIEDSLLDLGVSRDFEIDEAKSVTVNVTLMSADRENEESIDTYFELIRIGRSWYASFSDVGVYL